MATARRKFMGQGVQPDLNEGQVLFPAQVLSNDTTTTTATPGQFSVEVLTHADDTVTMFNFQVQAYEVATGDSALFDVAALVRRDGASATTLKDLVFKNGPFRDQAAWDVTVTVGSTTLGVQVTGEAGKTIKWTIFGWAVAQAS